MEDSTRKLESEMSDILLDMPPEAALEMTKQVRAAKKAAVQQDHSLAGSLSFTSRGGGNATIAPAASSPYAGVSKLPAASANKRRASKKLLPPSAGSPIRKGVGPPTTGSANNGRRKRPISDR